MKTGLVLSGGGARGVAHLGAIQALLDNGIKPDIISGVSSGAIIGSLYGAGMQPEEILEIQIHTAGLE
jgi:NTE family protein